MDAKTQTDWMADEGEDNDMFGDMILTVAEYLPFVSSHIQEQYRISGDVAALERARERDSIGTNGVLTQVAETIPLLNDGLIMLHNHHGQHVAAERARAFSLSRLMGKDGALTRIAELFPGSNLVTAAFHEALGNHKEAQRAINLQKNWTDGWTPDGALTKFAELLPGADLFALSWHLRDGHFAQALRAVTKTAWVNLSSDILVFVITTSTVERLAVVDLEVAGWQVIPRGPSLLGGVVSLLRHFAEIDAAGLRRAHRYSQSMALQLGEMAVDGTKDLLAARATEMISMFIESLTSSVPEYVDWSIDAFDEWLRTVNAENGVISVLLAIRCLKKAGQLQRKVTKKLQQTIPRLRVDHVELLPVRKVTVHSCQRNQVSMGTSAATCLAVCSCVSICGMKAGIAACIAGVSMCAHKASKELAVRFSAWLDQFNTSSWEAAVGSAESSDSSKKEGCQGSVASAQSLSGVSLKLQAEDVQELSTSLGSYFHGEFLGGGMISAAVRVGTWCLQRSLRNNMSTASTRLSIILDLSLDEQFVPLDGTNWFVEMFLPALPLALQVDFDVGSRNLQILEAKILVSDSSLSAFLDNLRLSIGELDLRELDPRFSGFIKPVKIQMSGLDCHWHDRHTIHVQAHRVECMLDVPD